MATEPTVSTELVDALQGTGYLADDGVATAMFLAMRMRRPLLCEGEPGTGKTSLAAAVAEALGLPLIRLQCHEGIDADQALYEWDYPRQLLHLRALEAAADGSVDPDVVERSLYTERFLLARPLLRALTEAPCLPGATLLGVDGDTLTAKVKVKLGPVTMQYKGTDEFVEKDETGHKLVIGASGIDVRSAGTAAATSTVTLTGNGERPTGSVLSEVDMTGQPAQFGRGIISEVRGKLLAEFAANLAEELASKEATESGTVGGGRRDRGRSGDNDGRECLGARAGRDQLGGRSGRTGAQTRRMDHRRGPRASGDRGGRQILATLARTPAGRRPGVTRWDLDQGRSLRSAAR